ncbi:MAG: UDP-3-O-(3-hydroxymyristoyl)glucosamine N-acyltransferase [Jaaginema sp. PMC 1079.18]|nr:UDP-3-O-(3-hydroxymyristoyl)glucosamine N-acyltransferase [Jaaginema sp. PMC 1080.18]MEC4849750.1 UDP-3-O-(3-hydroxymyristoyl)glucosamine N-acyltransferase [Jaaginema sp. PMC 1079.18]MEC4867480.1 UDP-3-O-(3-hydroxymyristoyl)glucosamine N-acyltransferase [Jaaginema sp. PMC 1078.18]
MKFSDIVAKLAADISQSSLTSHSQLNPEIQGVAAVDAESTQSISFIQDGKFAHHLATTPAVALILPENEDLQQQASEIGIAWMTTANTRLLFSKVLELFYQPYRPQGEIDPTAVVHPTAEIGQDVYIGPRAVIGENTKIGDRVCIHPNVTVYPEVIIGADTTLHANCIIHERSQIGQHCTIHSGAVIGDEGFGFVPTAQGWYKMPQSGYVILEDWVDIGANSTIDRPAVGVTRIGFNTKIDNLVQIGHGCQIGSNTVMAGQCGVAGSSKIGNGVILAGQVGIVNGVEIGDGAIASAKAGVHSNVKPGEIVTGIPAISHPVFVKASAVFKRLPDMHKTLKRLQRNSRAKP